MIVSTKHVDTRVNEENVKGNQIEKDADNYQLNFNETAVFCWSLTPAKFTQLMLFSFHDRPFQDCVHQFAFKVDSSIYSLIGTEHTLISFRHKRLLIAIIA